MSENGQQPEEGFEYQGSFYRWHVSDMGKDLMLIDRFSGLPVVEFFQLVEDEQGVGRTPVMLSLIATSIRHGHPEWSVERVARTVEQLNLSDVVFINPEGEAGEEEEQALVMRPPPEPPAREASSSPPSDSSSPSTPPANSSSETSFGTPV